jgi:hypothetical protein
MKDFIQRYWTPTAGAISSLSFKGIADISQSPVAEEAVKQIAMQPQPALITSLWIGILGGLGGLAVKIAWGVCKKIFPKLKNIDK